jgi:hypothetical protein
MRDFDDSSLWRISDYERMRMNTGTSGYMKLEGPTVLPTTLMAELHRLDERNAADDALEVMAACMRQRESALLYLQHGQYVWPVTLFPLQMLYHSPREMAPTTVERLDDLKLINIEPPGVRPPGHWMYERVGQAAHYRPLLPLLWLVALRGPRRGLLSEIGGTAAYRAIKDPATENLIAPGALGPSVQRLRRDAASLRDIASWPGMSVERASRLINALYLAQCLMMTRTNPAARSATGFVGRLLGLGRSRR